MKKLSAALLVALMVAPAACGSANLRHLPIASALIVHSCAVAEARAYLGSRDAFEKSTIHLEVGGENSAEGGAEGGVEYLKANFGISGVRSTAKAVEVEMTDLPTMAQCRQWGYQRQLGQGGCLLGTNGCAVVDSSTPWPSDPPPKAAKPDAPAGAPAPSVPGPAASAGPG